MPWRLSNIYVSLGIVHPCHLVIKFGVQAQRSINNFHDHTLASFHKPSLLLAEEDMKTTIASYVLDLTANGMKLQICESK